jgi:hypothetical protein
LLPHKWITVPLKSLLKEHGIGTLRLVTVGVEMDYDWSFAAATLNSKEGAGVLANLISDLTDKGSNNEELVVHRNIDHTADHELLELLPWRLKRRLLPRRSR